MSESPFRYGDVVRHRHNTLIGLGKVIMLYPSRGNVQVYWDVQGTSTWTPSRFLELAEPTVALSRCTKGCFDVG
jgi:hypothetical protein